MGFKPQFVSGGIDFDQANAGGYLDIDTTDDVDIESAGNVSLISNATQRILANNLLLQGLETTAAVGATGLAANLPAKPKGYYYIGPNSVVPFYHSSVVQPYPVQHPSIAGVSYAIDSVVTPLVVPAPTSINVGDYLVLCVYAVKNATPITTPSSIPAGFVLLHGGECLEAVSNKAQWVYGKVATLADVLATSFEIGNAGAEHYAACLYCVKSYSSLEYSVQTTIGAGAAAFIDCAGYDPVTAGVLFLTFPHVSTGVSVPSTTNFNPSTWVCEFADVSWSNYRSYWGVYLNDNPTGDLRNTVPGGAGPAITTWLGFAPLP